MNRAVLLLAHGTPGSPDEVPAYMKYVTGCRPIPQSVIDEVAHRYALIGKSPLTEWTLRQAAALERELGVKVYVGMRNWHPFIAKTLEAMRTDGVEQAVTICLAPQNSRTSVGLYKRAVEAAAGDIAVSFVESWHDHPRLVAAFAGRLRAALQQRPGSTVVFTAHSVPCRTVSSGDAGAGDPYSVQAKQTAALVAYETGLSQEEWCFAFQSQGMTGGPWIGPTVEETLSSLAAAGKKRVTVQPVGFVCDHVEVLYDIDIQFRQYAAALGIDLARTESLNDSPEFIAALAHISRAKLQLEIATV